MADKELRKMNRTELIEIIYALQQNDKTLRKENEDLRRQLDDKLIRVRKVGSIAEAALSLNHIFEDAQNASQQYLYTLACAASAADKEAQQTVEEARQQAEEILSSAREQQRQTEAECEQIRAEANRQAVETVKAVEQEIRALFQKYPELGEYLRRSHSEGGTGA